MICRFGVISALCTVGHSARPLFPDYLDAALDALQPLNNQEQALLDHLDSVDTHLEHYVTFIHDSFPYHDYYDFNILSRLTAAHHDQHELSGRSGKWLQPKDAGYAHYFNKSARAADYFEHGNSIAGYFAYIGAEDVRVHGAAAESMCPEYSLFQEHHRDVATADTSILLATLGLGHPHDGSKPLDMPDLLADLYAASAASYVPLQLDQCLHVE